MTTKSLVRVMPEHPFKECVRTRSTALPQGISTPSTIENVLWNRSALSDPMRVEWVDTAEKDLSDINPQDELIRPVVNVSLPVCELFWRCVVGRTRPEWRMGHSE